MQRNIESVRGRPTERGRTKVEGALRGRREEGGAIKDIFYAPLFANTVWRAATVIPRTENIAYSDQNRAVFVY